MEGLLQAFAKEIAVVGGLISAFLFGRANPWLRATLAGMVAIVLAAATYFFFSLPAEQRLRRCEQAWTSAQTENAISAYRGFLDGCPNSEYAGLARAAVRTLCEAQLDRAARGNDIEALDNVGHDCSDTPVAAHAQRSACQLRWRQASRENTRESYAEFQRECPQEGYPVAGRMCEIRWSEAIQRDTIDAYEEFRRVCPESPRISELNDRWCTAHWRQASVEDDVGSYRAFLSTCGSSVEATQASSRILQICERQWSQARESRELRAYQLFARDCTESEFHAQAIDRIDEAPPIWSLV